MNTASAGQATLSVQLTSDSWDVKSSGSAAVAEVVRQPGKRSTSDATAAKLKLSIGVNAAPQAFALALAPGDYTIRLFLPSGDVMAESVSLAPGAKELVRFELRPSPHEWLASELNLGTAQRLPDAARARSLEASLDAALSTAPLLEAAGPLRFGTASVREAIAQAVFDLDRGAAAVERISGPALVPTIIGWRWLSKIDPTRSLPDSRLALPELVRWWTGVVQPQPTRLDFSVHDARNAKLATKEESADSRDFLRGERRAFAAVRDPTGTGHYAVFPTAWASTSRGSVGTLATPSVLMTVVVDAAMASRSTEREGARWRCSTSVDDVEAMTYLGFLYAGQTSAADVMLEQAHEFLYEKWVNPVAAAAGAFGLLSHSAATNASERPAWRDWIANLHRSFPMLPDGAVAMAQMTMRYGEGSSDDEIDVERLRGFALDAVRRGLPYLSYSINVLLEILLMLVRDDEAEKRSGALIEQTRRAHSLVQQLGRIVAPGEFFTVLRFGAEFP